MTSPKDYKIVYVAGHGRPKRVAPLGHLAIGAVFFGLGLTCVLWAHSSFVRLP